MTSDWAIEQHNEQMATDADYAAAYAESEAFDQWRADEYFRREAEEEIYENFFDDYRISFDGVEEIDEAVIVLIDDDIPF